MNIDNTLNFIRALLYIARTSKSHNVTLDEEALSLLYNDLKTAKEECTKCKQTMTH